MKLFLENVRSFEGWHEIPIAPATVLVGENSAGKSTLLGMLSTVHQEGFPFRGNFFNQFPFELGNYKTIASTKNKTDYFAVGFETVGSDRFNWFESKEEKNVSVGMIATFRENDGLPVPCHVFGWVHNRAIAFYEQSHSNLDRLVLLNIDTKKIDIQKIEVPSTSDGLNLMQLHQAAFELTKNNKSKHKDKHYSLDFLIHSVFSKGFMRWDDLSTMAFAPMRSKPKRTYDQVSDDFSPEGDHVPLLLARASATTTKNAKELHEAIRAFGSYSEMFTDIDVKKLGKGSGDPFQIQVSMGTKKANLMDVGYGVSQVLPLIIDAQRAPQKTILLLQQPEVHLHPKAQAGLGSMVKDWVSKYKKTVVIETHSDYLVDRLRLEVKQKKLDPDSVKIFFLEKEKSKTTLHLISIDAEGNVVNAPEGYRDFFLREQMALLLD